jgi:hypothetical protein
MANTLIGIDVSQVQGVERVKATLDALPEDVQAETIQPVAELLVHSFQTYPPYKYISRRQAYGVPFFSDRQRRFFFAALADGTITIPYQRTQALRNNWQILGDGQNTLIVNETPYAGLMQGVKKQSRMAILQGWKDLDIIVTERAGRIQRIIEGGVKKAIKKHSKS